MLRAEFRLWPAAPGGDWKPRRAWPAAWARQSIAWFRSTCGLFGGSALTATSRCRRRAWGAGIPVTYVPARNTVFLSFALAWAEVLASSDIFIGVNAIDYSGYPDCRPEFIAAFEHMANLATKAGVEGRTHLKIHTPLIQLSKCEIIKLGAQLGVDFGLTHSCYDPDAQGRSCGLCDSCRLRLKGFAEAGLKDPLEYTIENR